MRNGANGRRIARRRWGSATRSWGVEARTPPLASSTGAATRSSSATGRARRVRPTSTRATAATLIVVFVEVKPRSSCDYGMPAEAVDEAKRDRYERIAALFLQGFHVVDVPVRFDIVSIVAISPDRAMIRHHINAFSGR